MQLFYWNILIFSNTLRTSRTSQYIHNLFVTKEKRKKKIDRRDDRKFRYASVELISREPTGNDLRATFPLERQQKEEHGVSKCLVTLRMAGVCVCYLEGEFLRDKIQGNTDPLRRRSQLPWKMRFPVKNLLGKLPLPARLLRIFARVCNRLCFLPHPHRLTPRNQGSKRFFLFSSPLLRSSSASLWKFVVDRWFLELLFVGFHSSCIDVLDVDHSNRNYQSIQISQSSWLTFVICNHWRVNFKSYLN